MAFGFLALRAHLLIGLHLCLLATAGCAHQSTRNISEPLRCEQNGPLTFDGTISEKKFHGFLEGENPDDVMIGALYDVTLKDLKNISAICTGDQVSLILSASNPGYLTPGMEIRVTAQDVGALKDSVSYWQYP